MVQKVSKARKKIGHSCTVCNGNLKTVREKVCGVLIRFDKCIECGEGEIPFSEALKIERAEKALRAEKAMKAAVSTKA